MLQRSHVLTSFFDKDFSKALPPCVSKQQSFGAGSPNSIVVINMVDKIWNNKCQQIGGDAFEKNAHFSNEPLLAAS